MINRFKNWLGIEGIKMEVDIPSSISRKKNSIQGVVEFSSMRDQHIQRLSLTLVETYRRGRGKDKRIDDHVLGSEIKDVNLYVEAGESYSYPFNLQFELLESTVDRLARNPYLGPIAKTLKWTNAVNSEYTLKVSADVRGTKLHPYQAKNVNFI